MFLNARLKIISAAVLVSVIALIAALSSELYEVPASAQEQSKVSPVDNI